MTTCNYYKYFNHAIEECLVLIVKMCEKRNKNPPTNIQMMTTEPREDEQHINIVTRSGVATGDDKGKKIVEEIWLRKTT